MAIKSVIVLVRHGETEWSKSGQHTGLTDLPLTEDGERDAAKLRPVLDGMNFGRVLISPLSRAQRTAALAGLTGETDADLLEWDYGAYEGRRTKDIRADLGDPTWTIWRDPIPAGKTPGEQPEQVADRARKVIADCLPVLEAGQDCALVAHGHFLRILTATWLGLPAVDGRMFALNPGALSRLGFEHEQHVIRTWNAEVPSLKGSAEHH
ncbi:MAG: histidine phosphatase family protein [Actinobacteria bacterium]|nr:histidine phosphatase family protein [Actinomycetota bacterium]